MSTIGMNFDTIEFQSRFAEMIDVAMEGHKFHEYNRPSFYSDLNKTGFGIRTPPPKSVLDAYNAEVLSGKYSKK